MVTVVSRQDLGRWVSRVDLGRWVSRQYLGRSVSRQYLGRWVSAIGKQKGLIGRWLQWWYADRATKLKENKTTPLQFNPNGKGHR